MKILQVIQKTQLRGAEIFACQLSSELIGMGHHVDIAYLFPYDPELIEQFPHLNFISLRAKASRRFIDFAAHKRIANLIIEGDYDLVQANAGDTLKYTATSRALFKWQALLIFRNATKVSGFIRNEIHRRLNSLFLHQCDNYISVSQNCREDLLRLFPELASRTVTIPIGTYSFDEVKAFPRTLPASEPVFINIGSFAREKNQLFLLDIFNLFYKKHSRGHLWILGEGKLRPQIEEKIRNFQLEDRVHLWGSRKDVLSILKSADVFIMPSIIEGLPGVILEALACQIPVIASNVGGIPEVIRNNISGFCVEQFNPAAYVDCMEILIADGQLRQRFLGAGLATLAEGYLMPVIASRFLSYYQKIYVEKQERGLRGN